jgi:hypothetical protein
MVPIDAAAPALLRRRVTPLGQEALRAAWGCAECAESRVIVSSRHGEFRRTLSILENLVDRAPPSPADFTLSVHHALAGLLSMAWGNRQGHTALAAGPESFCFGLMEAAACLTAAPKETVLLLHFDEPLPDPFSIFEEPEAAPEVLALVLAADGPGMPLELSVSPALAKAPSPLSHATEFIRFLESTERAELILVGERLEWRWRRHAPTD